MVHHSIHFITMYKIHKSQEKCSDNKIKYNSNNLKIIICQHGKFKPDCHICKSICEHGISKFTCKICSIYFCIHKIRKYDCKKCSEFYCIHKIRKYDCKVCDMIPGGLALDSLESGIPGGLVQHSLEPGIPINSSKKFTCNCEECNNYYCIHNIRKYDCDSCDFKKHIPKNEVSYISCLFMFTLTDQS